MSDTRSWWGERQIDIRQQGKYELAKVKGVPLELGLAITELDSLLTHSEHEYSYNFGKKMQSLMYILNKYGV